MAKEQATLSFLCACSLGEGQSSIFLLLNCFWILDQVPPGNRWACTAPTDSILCRLSSHPHFTPVFKESSEATSNQFLIYIWLMSSGYVNSSLNKSLQLWQKCSLPQDLAWILSKKRMSFLLCLCGLGHFCDIGCAAHVASCPVCHPHPCISWQFRQLCVFVSKVSFILRYERIQMQEFNLFVLKN